MAVQKESDKNLEKFEELNQDFDSDNRVIYLESEIDISVPSFIKQRVNLICLLTANNKDPITLELTSYGGDAFAAFSTIDTIRNFSMPINILGRGAIMSAAALLMAAGTGTRSITENTYIMLHSVSGALVGNTEEIMTEAQNIKSLNSKSFKILEKYTNKPITFWQTKCKKNFYPTPEQCVEYGLIDEIQIARHDT